MADIRSDVSELYVGFFARPAEPGGARFWDDFIADAVGAGRNLDAVEQEVAARFADSNEAKSLYGFLDNPQNGDASQFVDAIYQNLFNRTAEATGRRFWENRFEQLRDDGMPVERAASRFVLEILNAAENDDATTVQNKVEAATAYSERFIETAATFSVADDLSGAKQLIADTGASAASLQQAETRLDEILDANTTQSGVVTDGYVRGATVWADQDGDGEQDPDEPTTTTDENGAFTFTNDAGEEIQVGGRLIAQGGTDITTGLDFEGTLSAPESATTVSPLTSLVNEVQQQTGSSAEDAEARVKRALGLDDDVDLNTFDPIATLGNDNATDAQKQAALQVQAATSQVVNVASTAGAAAGEATGDEGAGTGNDQALSAIAQAITESGDNQTVDLTNADTVGNIVRDTLRRAGEASGQDLDDDRVENIATNAAEIARNANQRVRDATEQGDDPEAAFQTITRTQKVAQGEGAASVRQGAQNNDFSEMNERFGGDNFDDRVNETDVDVPDPVDDTPAAPGDGANGGNAGNGSDDDEGDAPDPGDPGDPDPGRTEIRLDGQTTDLQASGDSFLFVEDAARPSDVAIRNFSSDDRLTFEDAAFVGFTSTDQDLLIDTRGPRDDVSEIRLVDVLDGAVVSDEASAEAALGFDAFQVPDDAAPDPADGSSVQLDDANAPIDASDGDLTFIDDATVSSDAVLDNLAAGDTIAIQDADFVGFTSTASDILVDTRGPEDQISEIRLVGVNDGAVVSDQASAEAVLGFDAFDIA
jgi:hypothetical protein